MRLFLVLFVLMLLWLISIFRAYDSTDPPGGRSGMELFTDHGTGCQYLGRGAIFGGLTPRLDGAGKQVGCKQ